MKKITITIFIATLLVPQVVLASWWNPFDWIRRETKTDQSLEDKVKELEKRLDSQVEVSEEESNGDVQVNEKPLIQEKIVTQTIKVDNPELQAKIDILVKQNNDLILKNNDITSKYNKIVGSLNQCKLDLNSITNKSSVLEVDPRCEQSRDSYSISSSKNTELQAKQDGELRAIEQSGATADIIKRQSDEINTRYDLLIRPVLLDIDKAIKDRSVYCGY